jgi:subtilisin-like proprotein convertase family protein
MGRRISIWLVVCMLQTIWFVIPETGAKEKDLSDTKREQEIRRILKLRIETGTGQEEDILKAMGLKCEWGDNIDNSVLTEREAVCNATVSQMDQLKKAGITFEVEREGIRIDKKRSVRRPLVRADYEGEKQDKGVVWDENGTNYSIPYFDWVYSPISIASAPAGATVYSIDVHFEVIHTNVGDLAIDLTDEDIEQEYRLWNYEGGSQDNIDTTIEMIGDFIGELANQTWKLYAWDCCEGNTGHIDYWWIQIWYQDPPDLKVDSLTATNYSPNVGDYIDVTMVIKNQGNGPAYGWFYSGLFYDLSSPPDINTLEDEWWSTDVLDSGQTESNTFYSITSSEPGTWHMYGLADCDGEVVETNEANNHKGPITINWIQPVPDLIVQSLTLDDSSLVITEHTNGVITIKNQGSGPVADCFYTDVFKNRPSAPSPPATGE